MSVYCVSATIDTPATSEVESDLTHEIRKCGTSKGDSLQEGLDEITELSAGPQKRKKLLSTEPSLFLHPKPQH